MEEHHSLKWIIPDTLNVKQLIEILSRYPQDMKVITTWESTIHSILQENIYESKEGHLYLDADDNSCKDDYSKDIQTCGYT